MAYIRYALRRRKSAAAHCNEIKLDREVNFSTTPHSRAKRINGSRPLVRNIDLSDEPSAENGITPSTSAKRVKRTPTSKKKKRPSIELVTASPVKKPQSTITSSPRMMNVMKEAQAISHSVMEVNQRSRDDSIIESYSCNISGIQSLQESPISSKQQKNKVSLLLKDVVAFVEYKLNNEWRNSCIMLELIKLGAKVAKTFNLKVTHVVFHDGYRKTYTKAVKRNIPLVSAQWIEQCKLSNEIVDPVDFPSVDIKKYSKPIVEFKIPKNVVYKCLRPIDYKRDEQFKNKIEALMGHINNFQNGFSCIEGISDVTETTQETESSMEEDEDYTCNDIVSLLSKSIIKIIKTEDDPSIDEEIHRMYEPMPIKHMRKHLTPEGRNKKSSIELDKELFEIENRFKLNSQDRQRFRKLLFPLDEELKNMSIMRDFPSPSPTKLKTSTLVSSICTLKRKRAIFSDDEKLQQKKTLTQNTLKLQNASDLRPKQVKNITIQNKKKCKSSLIQETIPNMFSGNSRIFQTSKASVAKSIRLKSIACTGLTKNEVNIIKLVIRKLGGYIFHSEVKSSTTHVVIKSQSDRTLPMIFAMAFGCFIISEEWIHESYQKDKWLPCQTYLIQNLSEPIKEFQMRCQSLFSYQDSLKFHIFGSVGIMYIADTCESARDLKRLVRACGGQCTSIETMADVVIGHTPRINNSVSENWILDCVCQGILLDKFQYKLVNNNMT